MHLINAHCHQMFYMRGLVAAARAQWKVAKQFYNDALAINPSHFPTLIQLTKLLIQFGNYSLAEKYARDAIAIQPANYQPWSVDRCSRRIRRDLIGPFSLGIYSVWPWKHAANTNNRSMLPPLLFTWRRMRRSCLIIQ
jgi:tetratricopeptide (TPR) repeat protein